MCPRCGHKFHPAAAHCFGCGWTPEPQTSAKVIAYPRKVPVAGLSILKSERPWFWRRREFPYSAVGAMLLACSPIFGSLSLTFAAFDHGRSLLFLTYANAVNIFLAITLMGYSRPKGR